VFFKKNGLGPLGVKTSWLLHFAHINKGPNAPTLHMPHTSVLVLTTNVLILAQDLDTGLHHSSSLYPLHSSLYLVFFFK
jgi:hypothetical protein